MWYEEACLDFKSNVVRLRWSKPDSQLSPRGAYPADPSKTQLYIATKSAGNVPLSDPERRAVLEREGFGRSDPAYSFLLKSYKRIVVHY